MHPLLKCGLPLNIIFNYGQWLHSIRDLSITDKFSCGVTHLKPKFPAGITQEVNGATENLTLQKRVACDSKYSVKTTKRNLAGSPILLSDLRKELKINDSPLLNRWNWYFTTGRAFNYQCLRTASHFAFDEQNYAFVMDNGPPEGSPSPRLYTAGSHLPLRPVPVSPSPGSAALAPPAPHQSDPQVAMLDRFLRISLRIVAGRWDTIVFSLLVFSIS